MLLLSVVGIEPRQVRYS